MRLAKPDYAKMGGEFMTCKFTVTCRSCGCRMELTDGKDWESRGRTVCQNCGEEMPPETYSFFSDAMNSIAVIPNKPEGFSLSINSDWKSEP